MKSLNCDVCNVLLEDPIPSRTYWHIGHRDICEACHDRMEFTIKPTVRSKQPFDYNWYLKLIQDSIEKAIQKGKFEVKKDSLII